MKRVFIILLIVLTGGFVSQAQNQKKGRAVVCFQSSMDCINCEQTLFEHLRFVKGVKDLKVDHVSNTIFIEYLEKKNNGRSLAEAIEKKGYKAEKISLEKYNSLMKQTREEEHDHEQKPQHEHQ